MNYENAFGADFRKVDDRTHDGQPVRVVIATRLYTTDRADLWNALTDAKRLPRWFAPVTGQLELGGRYQLEGNAAGSILKCAPPKTFEITWEFGEHVSWVHVMLTQEIDGTKMTLEHLIPKHDVAEEHWKQYGPGAGGIGWDLSIFGLALHLDSGGESIDQDKNNAWLVSDAGKAFMRSSADHWRAAHVDSGEDADIAEAMSNQTDDFYTNS